jgi:Uma2 family endonuclease
MQLQLPKPITADEPHVVMRDVSWEFYQALSRECDDRPIRINYANRVLEIMTISTEHDGYRDAISDLLTQISLEFKLPIAKRGSATLKLEAKEKALEPDQCCWVANERVLRGVRRLDLAIHPPPDLVVEVDITHAVVDREAIYAAIGVPEMWHFDKQTGLTAWERRGAEWSRIEVSKSFPAIRVADLTPFLERWWTEGQQVALMAFQEWLKKLPR